MTLTSTLTQRIYGEHRTPRVSERGSASTGPRTDTAVTGARRTTQSRSSVRYTSAALWGVRNVYRQKPIGLFGDHEHDGESRRSRI